jgi:hypothetical protein
VEIAYAVDGRGDPLRVASFVTLRVFIVNLSDSVERLVNVTHVMDD